MADLQEIRGVGPSTVAALAEHGITSVKRLASIDLGALEAVRGFGVSRAQAVRAAARSALPGPWANVDEDVQGRAGIFEGAGATAKKATAKKAKAKKAKARRAKARKAKARKAKARKAKAKKAKKDRDEGKNGTKAKKAGKGRKGKKVKDTKAKKHHRSDKAGKGAEKRR